LASHAKVPARARRSGGAKAGRAVALTVCYALSPALACPSASLSQEPDVHVRVPHVAITLLLLSASAAAAGCGSESPMTTPPTPAPSTPPPATLAACKLPRVLSGNGLGFPRNPARALSTGQLRYKVLFVEFQGAAATLTPQAVFAIISPTSESYFQTVSYGRMTLSYQTEFQWLRMSKTAGDYEFNTFQGHQAYIQEAVSLAGSTVDYSQTDALLVMADPTTTGLPAAGAALVPNAGSGVTAGGRLFTNAATSGRGLSNSGAFFATHEIGHNLGLLDLYSASAPTHRYVGMFSMMGFASGPARELFAVERWILGWLDDSQITCVTGSGTTDVALTPLTHSGGMKSAVVPISTTAAVVVESRRTGGYDSGFTEGALVYVVDTAIRSQQGPIRVLPLNDSDDSKGTTPLTSGRSLTHEGVTVSVVSAGAAGDAVRIVK
jgi:M6 family metalloprotease-like protein